MYVGLYILKVIQLAASIPPFYFTLASSSIQTKSQQLIDGAVGSNNYQS